MVYVLSLVIDKNRLFTPCRPISKGKLTYTDHYSLILKFKNIPMRNNQVSCDKKNIRWNTNKEGGWNNYRKMTTENRKLMEVVRDNSEDSNRIMKKIDNELEAVKHKVFSKVKEHSKGKANKQLEALQQRKMNTFSGKQDKIDEEKLKTIDEEIALNLLQQQRKAFDSELKNIH